MPCCEESTSCEAAHYMDWEYIQTIYTKPRATSGLSASETWLDDDALCWKKRRTMPILPTLIYRLGVDAGRPMSIRHPRKFTINYAHDSWERALTHWLKKQRVAFCFVRADGKVNVDRNDIYNIGHKIQLILVLNISSVVWQVIIFRLTNLLLRRLSPKLSSTSNRATITANICTQNMIEFLHLHSIRGRRQTKHI